MDDPDLPPPIDENRWYARIMEVDQAGRWFETTDAFRYLVAGADRKTVSGWSAWDLLLVDRRTVGTYGHTLTHIEQGETVCCETS